MRHNSTHFRIDPPSRSGHIQAMDRAGSRIANTGPSEPGNKRTVVGAASALEASIQWHESSLLTECPRVGGERQSYSTVISQRPCSPIRFSLKSVFIFITLSATVTAVAIDWWTRPFVHYGYYANGARALEQWERRTVHLKYEHIRTIRYYSNGQKAMEYANGKTVCWSPQGERISEQQWFVNMYAETECMTISDFTRPSERLSAGGTGLGADHFSLPTPMRLQVRSGDVPLPHCAAGAKARGKRSEIRGL